MAFLRTATGKDYICDFMGVAEEHILFVQVAMELHDVIDIFNDPNETSTLQWIGNNGEIVRTETGFVVYTSMAIVKGECPVRVRLRKRYADEIIPPGQTSEGE